jgi:hypothetical protein
VVDKDQRSLYVCPQCNGAQVVMKWKRAQLDDHPEVPEIQTLEDCPTCDGLGRSSVSDVVVCLDWPHAAYRNPLRPVTTSRRA